METIIIQDIDQDILDILKFALEEEHFSVYAVLELESNFLEMIEELRPHVIMLDYRLDGQTCINICHQIKAHYPNLPVIAMSCNININEVYDRHGFDDYIAKPFDLNMLYGTLRKYIPKHDSLKS
jgi:DNA-binding response OmpR family regulator